MHGTGIEGFCKVKLHFKFNTQVFRKTISELYANTHGLRVTLANELNLTRQAVRVEAKRKQVGVKAIYNREQIEVKASRRQPE